MMLAPPQALVATGRFAEAHAILLESLALAPADGRAAGRGSRRPARGSSGSAASHERAHARLIGALDGLEDHGSREAVVLMVELGRRRSTASSTTPMRDWAARALAAPAARRPAADRRGAGARSRWPARRRRRSRRPSLTAPTRRRSSTRCPTTSSPAPGRRGQPRHRRDLPGPLRGGGGHAERALAIGRATGQGELFPVLVLRSAAALLRGRPAAARRAARRGRRSRAPLGQRPGLALSLLNRARAGPRSVTSRRRSPAEESVELGRGLDASWLGHWASGARRSAPGGGRPRAGGRGLLVAAAGGEDLTSIPVRAGSARWSC